MDASEDARRREAARWTVLRDRGMSPAERDEFERWLAADPRHTEALERSAGAWAMLDRIPEGVARSVPPREASSPFPRWAVPLGVVAAAVFATAVFEHHHPVSRAPAAADTVPPSLARVDRLDDGTVVRLDSASEIAPHFTRAERRVELLHGRAFFEVSKNPARPFVVLAGNVQVRAVGTAFDVSLEPTVVEVLVTEGRVSVASDLRPGASSGPGQVVDVPLLLAGQRALVSLTPGPNESRAAVSTLSPRDMTDAMAWQEPLLNLGGSTLADLAAEFQQRTGQRLVLSDPALATLRIGGRFRADDIGGFVQLLEDNYGVDAESRNGQIILSYKKGSSEAAPGNR